VLVVTRYEVPAAEQAAFLELARAALEALAARPGCAGGRVGRSVDQPDLWTLTTTWESVGAYRRALSAPEVKTRAVPLMYRALNEPGAYEDLLTWSPLAGLAEHASALADGTPGGPGARPGPLGAR
jgi:quinol monooxygenase YgiN